jgi:ATPase subunit of ABC transporter with duplicated ATPase domains
MLLLLLHVCRPSVVFTCLALFNVLIAPLNAFPWVVNGVVEAFVSLHRIQAYLLLPQRANEWAYAEDVLPQIQEFQQQRKQQQKWQQNGAAQQQQWHEALLGGPNAHKQQQQQLSSKTKAGQMRQQGSSSSSSGRQVLLRRGAAAALERGVVAQFDNATFAWKQVRLQPKSLYSSSIGIQLLHLTLVM